MFTGGRTQGSIGHSTALGGAVKLAGYTEHASLLLALAQQQKTHHRIPIFTGIYADLLPEVESTVKMGKYRISVWKSITMQNTHTILRA
jgi:hypothetical protein